MPRWNVPIEGAKEGTIMADEEKYVITVHPDTRKVTKVEHMDEDGALTEVEGDASDAAVKPMIMSPWQHRPPKKG